jgi:hypothetical protein
VELWRRDSARGGRPEGAAVKDKRRLTNPVRDLFNEVTNDRASWTDATFWFVLGVLLDTVKDIVIAAWVK